MIVLLLFLPDIQKWNTNNVTDISYIFSSCSSFLPDISKRNNINLKLNSKKLLIKNIIF